MASSHFHRGVDECVRFLSPYVRADQCSREHRHSKNRERTRGRQGCALKRTRLLLPSSPSKGKRFIPFIWGLSFILRTYAFSRLFNLSFFIFFPFFFLSTGHSFSGGGWSIYAWESFISHECRKETNYILHVYFTSFCLRRKASVNTFWLLKIILWIKTGLKNSCKNKTKNCTKIWSARVWVSTVAQQQWCFHYNKMKQTQGANFSSDDSPKL